MTTDGHYRRGVLNSEHAHYLTEVSTNVCGDLGVTLAECTAEDDHVHLLAGYTSKVPISTLANSLKG